MKLNTIFYVFCILAISSCATKKLISSHNTFYHVKPYPPPQGVGGTPAYDIVEIKPVKKFKAKLTEVGDNLVITPIDSVYSTTRNTNLDQNLIRSYTNVINKSYYPESTYFMDSSRARFVYYDIKFGLQALTIPMKFRRGVGNDSLNPPNIETGFNIGFAPAWKFQKNMYRPVKNYLGSHTSQLSIVVGPFTNLSTTDLNKDNNAPGLLSNRKRPVLSFGGFCLFSFNNISVGYAVGFDNVLGTGKNYWVYQGKWWQGVIVSLDVLKF